MSCSLSTALNIPDTFWDHQLICVTSNDLNTSSFLIPSLLQTTARNAKFRQTFGQVFCSLFSQSYLNHSFLHMKCGLNLKSLCDSGSIAFFDLLANLDNYEQGDQKTINTQNIVNDVLTRAEQFFKQRDVSGLRIVMIDDLSILLSLGMSSVKVYEFVQSLRLLCNTYDARLLLQLFVHEDDDRLERLASAIRSASSFKLHIQSLETGYSKEFDGTLTIQDEKVSLDKKYLIKCTDRMVKLYTPGSAGL